MSFKGNLNTRNNISETVDLVAKDLIKAVLVESFSDPEGNGRELLKPENLALASPRIFWSLIYHFGM